MKFLFNIIFLFLVSIHISQAMEIPRESTYVASKLAESIPFKNKHGEVFSLVPLHLLDEKTTIDSLYRLFQDERVYKFYERGCTKSQTDCENLYKRVSKHLQNWKGEQLGWVAIMSGNKFKGFIGAYIQGTTIEACVAVDPELQQTKIAYNGLMEYMSYFWPRLSPEVTAKITGIKSPINPDNKASCALASCVYGDAVDDKIYVPDYYLHLSKEKGQRVSTFIPIKVAMQKVEKYLTDKAAGEKSL